MTRTLAALVCACGLAASAAGHEPVFVVRAAHITRIFTTDRRQRGPGWCSNVRRRAREPELRQRLHVAEAVAIGDDQYDDISVVIPRASQPSLLLRLKY